MILFMVSKAKAKLAPATPGKFPRLTGETLTGRKVTLPDDLDRQVNLLILVFSENAQYKVNTWARMILADYEPLEAVSYYEVPMLSGWYRPMAWQIDGWMRQGIPKQYHENTVTFYGDRTPYIEQLGMPDKNSCYLFVLDDQGSIVYRSDDIMSPAKEAKLKAILNKLLS